MADALLSGTGNTAPVSLTKYTVLAEAKNVRLMGIEADVTWGVTQPSLLEVIVTVSDIPFIFKVADPVSTTKYFASLSTVAADSQILETIDRPARTYLLEGRSVKVEIRVTWATTQPTPLNCRVKYAKW
jgi:hypothetical protein